MKLLHLSAVIAFLALSQANGVYVKRDLSTLTEVREYVQGMARELQELTVEIKTAMDTLSSEGSNKISAPVHEALFLLKLHPEHCTVGVERNLLELKQSRVGSFFHCSNLTDAFVETGSLIFKTLKLTTDIVMSINDLMQITVGCHGWNPVALVKCWVNKIDKITSDIKKDTAEVETYVKDVRKLGKEIKANIEYCTKPHAAHVQKAVNEAMLKVHQCATAHPN